MRVNKPLAERSCTRSDRGAVQPVGRPDGGHTLNDTFRRCRVEVHRHGDVSLTCDALLWPRQLVEHLIEAHGYQPTDLNDVALERAFAPVGDAKPGVKLRQIGGSHRVCECGNQKLRTQRVCETCRRLENDPGHREQYASDDSPSAVAWRVRRKAAMAAGLCGACRTNKPKEGLKSCQPCITKSVERNRQVREARRQKGVAR